MSCETAPHNLVRRIEVALIQKTFALGTFLDIEGSFDIVSYDSMIIACREHTIDDRSMKWINSMLKNRAVGAGSSEWVSGLKASQIVS
jgi:hypothetical protein